MSWEEFHKTLFQVCFNIMSADSDEETKRTNIYKLVDVVNAAAGLADVLDDRVHRHLDANEKHWHRNLKKSLEELEGEE